MPGQADLDTATNDWITAADKALSIKENARKSYDEELEYGMQPGSFDNWVARNAPQLHSAFMQYNAKRTYFFNVLNLVDFEKAKDWSGKELQLRMHRTKGHLDDGKDEGSNLIIVTANDIEQYDEIIEGMNAATKKAIEDEAREAYDREN